MEICQRKRENFIQRFHIKIIFRVEKGADFSGESVLQREFELEGKVNQVKVQLAFSTSELRQRTTALLLVQTDNK